MSRRKLIAQILIIAVVEVLALIILQALLPGLAITRVVSALALAGVFILSQIIMWWVFVTLFSWLPVILYPLLTFVLSGIAVVFFGDLIPGVSIANLGTGIWMTLGLTATNAILAGILSVDIDERFDRNVTRKLVLRRSKPTKTDVPGIIFLEIDGLGEKIFRHALEDGHMPNLKRWLDRGSHTILGWETDFTSQTGAMQTGILLGNNDDIPAYRWWDRATKKIIMSGNPKDAKNIEARLSNGKGLLSDGGASRGNMFSGDAAECLLTMSTVLDRSRSRGPGFYLYLLSPAVMMRMIVRYFTEVFKEWRQAYQQRRRKDKYMVSARNLAYGFFRALMGTFFQELATYTVISDILRGMPAVYALYAGYDDLSHFAGMSTPDAYEMLTEIDHHFARIEKNLEFAPRPYNLVVLSDHGQSSGPTFKSAYGMSLEELVKGLVKNDQEVFATLDTHEAWDNINAFLSESVNADTRTARVLRTALRSKQHDGGVTVGPNRDEKEADKEQGQAQAARVIVLGSGSTGLIYFGDAEERLTYEQIQERYPELIVGLVSHPGVGFVLVRSQENGDMVVGKGGFYYLKDNTVEGHDPLAVYSPNAAAHLRRESGFSNCPDLIVNTVYDPVTEELAGFENQASHHGGLGGPQNFAFIFHPTELPVNGDPIVGATHVYRLLRSWRADLPVEAQAGLQPAAALES